jgi:ferric-dicitrate binding protein FerR (iron transport regulator)
MKLNEENNPVENLIHEYLKGSISEKEKDLLFRWIARDESNVSYFNQISDIWLSTSVFQDTEDFNSEEAFKRVNAKINAVNALKPEENKRSFRLSWPWVAAILLPVIILSSLVTKLVLTDKIVPDKGPYTFEVPYGSKSSVLLPDGSRVVLNSGSRLTCKEGFGIKHRVLNLVGEGYFNVAKNKNLPFVVHAGNLDVKALGTEFNVKAYPEDKIVETILIHGSIQVIKKADQGKDEKPLILMPKQILVYNKKCDSIQVNIVVAKNDSSAPITLPEPQTPKVVFSKTDIDPVVYTTWKEKSWNIYQKDILDLAVELERKYDVKIHFSSEALKNIKFTGTLRDESLEQVLAAIRLAAPIEYKVKGKQVELNENKDLMLQYNQYYRN